MSFRTLPKIELHLHLEGAAPPDFIRGLAQEKSINLDGVFNHDGSYAFTDFTQFLRTYEAATTVLQTPEDFGRLTRAVLEQSAEEGVIYTEAFLSPDFCGNCDVAAWWDYLAAMQEAADAAERDCGIIMRGIVTCIRHFGPENARETALCAAETKGKFITGFGIAGDEMAGAPVDFAYAFDMAREAELSLTAHAGEWGGAQSVKDALRDLRPSRIGHGVQAISDPTLVDHLAETGVHLEVCPGSNVALGVFASLNAHPFENLRMAGVNLSISTDDPPFFHTSLSREYDNLADCFGYDEAIFTEINVMAANAAFCDAETRATLLKKLEPDHV